MNVLLVVAMMKIWVAQCQAVIKRIKKNFSDTIDEYLDITGIKKERE